MELPQISALLTRYLEAGPLADAEGEQLLTAMEELIDKNGLTLLTGTRFTKDGMEKALTAEEVENCYWEIYMYYGQHEEDDHHHDDEDEEYRSHMGSWWWVYFLLAAIGFFVIWKLTQGHS
ncbi:hypothetical protein [Chitinophaga pinensis]|uniref:Uncharacterized protein n=1 Tax=Chitinophaga pinensis (strain ATCC 43595 / DSM 2588 / LMG 13176 / NBRC 15968 / NCIMB 11800 / UQM 2034) TaxID=485918 RepID=A0A979G4L6_CHIPD|nr:hypothetical protein [Chitinophaga pinensis]ACU60750.1 hypothetical protein Cpin_3283 [Chitinophaga pinensis DSM 2588]